MPLPETRTLILPPGNESLKSSASYETDISDDPFEDLTEAQLAWQEVLLALGQAYPGDWAGKMDSNEVIDKCRQFAFIFADIPLDRLPDVYIETLRKKKDGFPINQDHFRAAWGRIQGNTRPETFQEQEKRLEAQSGHQLTEGEREIPLSSQIFRKLNRAIVCKCKYADGIPMAARIEDLGRGPRWICGRGRCNLNVDANDEKAVAAIGIEPFIFRTGAEVLTDVAPPPAPVVAENQQSRAELFAESCNLDWLKMDNEQREILRQMAKWSDWCKKPTDAGNFNDRWDEYLNSTAYAKYLESAGAGGT